MSKSEFYSTLKTKIVELIGGNSEGQIALKSSTAILEQLESGKPLNRIEIDVLLSTLNISQIFDAFGISEGLRNNLNEWAKRRDLIILANGKRKETKYFLNILFPDFIHIDFSDPRAKNIESRMIIYIAEDEPIDLLSIFRENILQSSAENKFDQPLPIGVISLIPLKRQCGACAKSTQISEANKSEFPRYMQKKLPNSYLFSRGCNNCQYKSYKGITFLESYVVYNDLSSLISQPFDTDINFRVLRDSGLITFHESGLEKLLNTVTSVEQIIEHAPKVSAAFEKVLDNSDEIKIHNPKAQRSILIVEDDKDQREILEVVFKKEGFSVIVAENGKEALTKLHSSKVDIILSDIMMPIMNGLQLVKSVKSDKDLKHIPVLMLTASSNPDHEVKLLEEGADDYCAKNVKKRVLLTRVEKLLTKSDSFRSSITNFLID